MRIILAAAALFLAWPASQASAGIPTTAFAEPASVPRAYGAWTPPSLGEAPVLGRLTIRPFLAGQGFKGYSSWWGGVGAEVPFHANASALAGATSRQLHSADARTSPLDPDEPADSLHRFVRLSCGLRFALPWHLSFEAWAGADAAGGRSNVFEGNLEWWPIAYSYHPVRVEVGVSKDDRTRLRVHTASGEAALGRRWGLSWYATGTGRVFAGKAIGRAAGWAGGGLGVGGAGRGWGLRLEGGGGAHGGHVDLSLFHHFRL